MNEYVAYFEPSGEKGFIDFYEEGVVLREGRSDTPVRTNYVQSVSRKEGGVLLGKIGVQLDYYNLFGNKESVALRMRESDFLALKKDLGK